MAIEIDGTVVINDSREIINAVGIGTSTSTLYGDSSNLVNSSATRILLGTVTTSSAVSSVFFRKDSNDEYYFDSSKYDRYLLTGSNITTSSSGNHVCIRMLDAIGGQMNNYLYEYSGTYENLVNGTDTGGFWYNDDETGLGRNAVTDLIQVTTNNHQGNTTSSNATSYFSIEMFGNPAATYPNSHPIAVDESSVVYYVQLNTFYLEMFSCASSTANGGDTGGILSKSKGVGRYFENNTDSTDADFYGIRIFTRNGDTSLRGTFKLYGFTKS